MKLLFAHGWGFDRHFWEPLTTLLPKWEHVVDDQGYFGETNAPVVDGPCLAVTHSFGTIRLLSAPPPGLIGIVAVNGFERFTAVPGLCEGVPLRVLDHMLRRFSTNPRGVLTEFRKACGSDAPFAECVPEPLLADLCRMRDAAPLVPDIPLIVMHGGKDPLLPQKMRDATFSGFAVNRIHPVHRINHTDGGHLLPWEAPELCAAAIRGMAETLSV